MGNLPLFAIPPEKFSRRRFLQAAFRRTTAVGLSLSVLQPLLSACALKSETTPLPVPPTAASTAAPQPLPTAILATATPFSPPSVATPTPAVLSSTTATMVEAASPTAQVVEASTATPRSLPDLVVARGGEPEDLVRRAMAALGGMEQFVSKNARVVIKPNICTSYYTYEFAATTNPWVVAALVKLCFEAGAKTVQVLDYPFGGSLMDAYETSGIAEQVKSAGGEMTPMAGYKYVAVDIPAGTSLKKTKAYQDVLQADVLINVPIAKHHSSTRLTLGMKNLMGIIQNRNEIHADLWHRIPDLASLFKPQLTVIDAVRILTAHGPTGGSLDDVRKLDTVIASADIVAADAFASTLFELKPKDIPYIPAAAEAGLGRMDLGALRIEEVQVGG